MCITELVVDPEDLRLGTRGGLQSLIVLYVSDCLLLLYPVYDLGGPTRFPRRLDLHPGAM